MAQICDFPLRVLSPKKESVPAFRRSPILVSDNAANDWKHALEKGGKSTVSFCEQVLLTHVFNP